MAHKGRFLSRISRKKVVVIAVVALLLAAGLALEGELAILLADRRPEAEAARLIAALDVRDRDTIAEIGAGAGRLSVALARALPSSRIYSTELSAARLEDIREAVAAEGLTNVEVLEAATAGTNLPDGCCDAVFMRNVYHHFTAPPTMVEAIARALKPGGRLGIIDFEPRGIWKWFAVPHGTPDRGGHGVPMDVLEREVTGTGAFAAVDRVPRWAGSLYFLSFEKN